MNFYCVTKETFSQYTEKLTELGYKDWPISGGYYSSYKNADFLENLGEIDVGTPQGTSDVIECTLLGLPSSPEL